MKEKKDPVRIRMAASSDAAAILSIYEPYVKETAISFEYAVPSLEEFKGRVEKTLEKYPYLVAVEAGEDGEEKILGYAYTGPFKARAAYDHAAETSIYVSEEAHGRGIGKRLYEALEEASLKQGILSLMACITYPHGAPEVSPGGSLQGILCGDEYVTTASALFHEHLGYRFVGRFDRCGYKFGRWYDMIWMQKHLTDLPADPGPVIPYPEA